MEKLDNEMRLGGRKPDEMRKIEWLESPAPAAASSLTVKIGNTHVICAVSIQDRVPRWMHVQHIPGGWLTAEYRMLPYANPSRGMRESSMGKIGGRTHEIQRLIGRSLRSVVDLEALGKRTVWVDCDVLQADGGTRTAAITGAYTALRLAVDGWLKSGLIEKDPIAEPIAAISVGLRGETALLDLCYEEDAEADVDMNVVMTESGKFIEVQGTAEETPFSRPQLQDMLALAEKGVGELITEQKSFISSVSSSV